MNKGVVLILGARSDIGLAIAQRFAKSGYDIQLAARNANNLEIQKADIALRNQISVTSHEFDALDTASHDNFLKELPVLPNIVVCVVGYMGLQKENERDLQVASVVLRSNFEGPANILAAIANRFEERGNGCLVGVSSIAGERGRAKNYVYGSAKAGFTAFLSGLRNRLAKTPVHVVSVLPGFVETKMTENMNFPKQLTAQPAEVADKVFKAVQTKRNIVYVKPIWQLIILIIKIIPEQLFKKMQL